MTCHIIPPSGDVSSTTHSSISGGPRSISVLQEVIDLVHHLLCPQDITPAQIYQQRAMEPPGSTDASEKLTSVNPMQPLFYTDYETLRGHVVMGDHTVMLLLELL